MELSKPARVQDRFVAPYQAESGALSSDVTLHAVHSPDLPDLLERLGITLLLTTYQANSLLAIRAGGGRISTLVRRFETPMGLAANSDGQLALGIRNQVWFFRNARALAPAIEPAGRHDACFLPRSAHVTGNIMCHEMAWVGKELWVVNTLFSCLCTLEPEYSFVPRWRPPFVSALAPEDRCHLNGLAATGAGVRYATSLGESDGREGWRKDQAAGGCVIDVPAGAVVARGLSMPHSPRLHNAALWVLDSGRGALLQIHAGSGRAEAVVQLPGYTRGLAMYGPFAFVGLSKIRETSSFQSLPIAQRKGDLQCGVWVVDLRTGQAAGFYRFESGIREIFAVEVLPGCHFPEIVGFQQNTLESVYVIPPVSRAHA